MNPATNKKAALTGFILALVSALLFSMKAVLVKLAFRDTRVDAVSLLALRMLVALPFFLLVGWLSSRKSSYQPLTHTQKWQVAVLGLLGYHASSFLDFAGLQYISAGLERIVLFLYPTFTVLIQAYWFGDKISKKQWIALLLTYSGIIIAYMGELGLEGGSADMLWGGFLVFLCAITFSIYLSGSGRLIPRVGANRFTAYAMLSATAGIFIHYLLKGDYDFGSFTKEHYTYGILLGLFTTVIPVFMVSGALKRVGSNNVAIVSGIGPVSTIIQAHYLLGEPIFPAQLAGAVLVIAGIILIGWKSHHESG